MQAREIRNEARERFALNRYHAMLVYGVVYTLALNIAVLTTVLFLLNRFAVWYGIVLIFLFFLFLAPFGFGMTGFYVRLYRFEKVDAFHVFDGFNKYNLERVIVMRLLKFALWLAFTILLIVPGVIFSLRTCMATYILRANPKLKPQDALRASNKIMKGHCWKYFCLELTFAGWFLMAILTLGLGFIWLAPYFNASKIVFFKREIQGDKTVYRNPEARVIADTTLGVEEEERARLMAEIARMEEQMLAGGNAPKTPPVNAQAGGSGVQPQQAAKQPQATAEQTAVKQPQTATENRAQDNTEGKNVPPLSDAVRPQAAEADEPASGDAAQKSDQEPLHRENAARQAAEPPVHDKEAQSAEQPVRAEAVAEPKVEAAASDAENTPQAAEEERASQPFDMQAERERALQSLREQRRKAAREITENSGESEPKSAKEQPPVPGAVPPPQTADRRSNPPQRGAALPHKESVAVEIGENGEARTALARERLEKLRAAREQAKHGRRENAEIEIKEDEE